MLHRSRHFYVEWISARGNLNFFATGRANWLWSTPTRCRFLRIGSLLLAVAL